MSLNPSPFHKSRPAQSSRGTASNPAQLFFDSETSKARFVTDLSDRDSRAGFIRKVYGILGCQLAVTFGMVLWASLNRGAAVPFFLGPSGSALMTLAMVGSFACAVMLQMRPSLQEGTNGLAVLGLFTAFESVLVTAITLMYRAPSVMLAVAQTAAMTAGLSLYAMQPNPKVGPCPPVGSTAGVDRARGATPLLLSPLA